MIEVTEEMLRRGNEALWLGYQAPIDLAVIYRAMRALEPIAPELRNRQWPQPVLRAEDQAKPPGWDTAGYPKETPWYDRRTVAQAHARIDIIVPIIRELSGFFKGTERGDRLQILLQQLERAMERAIAPPTGGS